MQNIGIGGAIEVLFGTEAQRLSDRVTDCQGILKRLNLWKSAGDTAVEAQKYTKAIYSYACGEDTYKLLRPTTEKYGLSTDSVVANEFHSLVVDICNEWSPAINKLVGSAPDSGRGMSTVSVKQLERSIALSMAAIWSPGLLEDQRQKALFNRAVACLNRADLEFIHGQNSVKAQEHLEESARDFFLSDQLVRPCERKPNRSRSM
jgi:hypothetical protein